MLTIESPHNDTFKKFLSLTGSKGLKNEKLFLLSGEKLIYEFLKNPRLKIVAEIITSSLLPLSMLNLDKSAFPVISFTGELFAQLDVLGTHFNILVLEQPILRSFTVDDVKSYLPQGVEVVIPMGDPGNLGALIRSCEAFAVPHVFLTQEAAHPFLPKAVKASAGSVVRVPMTLGPPLHYFPRDCLALDAQGTAINHFVWPNKALLIVGEEGRGFGDQKPRGYFKQTIRIPTQGVESLNVVVAASIALAHKAGAI